MKIIYLHQYYKKIEELGAHRYYYLSKHLAEKHDVSIISSRDNNSNNIISGLNID